MINFYWAQIIHNPDDVKLFLFKRYKSLNPNHQFILDNIKINSNKVHSI